MSLPVPVLGVSDLKSLILLILFFSLLFDLVLLNLEDMARESCEGGEHLDQITWVSLLEKLE